MTDLLGLTTFRTDITTLMSEGLPNDVGVFDAIPDSIAPPAVYVTWSNPWVIQTTWCEYTTRLQLIAVAQRIEPGGQYGVLETLIGEIVEVLRTNRIPFINITSPYPINLGGVDYLASSINIISET